MVKRLFVEHIKLDMCPRIQISWDLWYEGHDPSKIAFLGANSSATVWPTEVITMAMPTAKI